MERFDRLFGPIGDGDDSWTSDESDWSEYSAVPFDRGGDDGNGMSDEVNLPFKRGPSAFIEHLRTREGFYRSRFGLEVRFVERATDERTTNWKLGSSDTRDGYNTGWKIRNDFSRAERRIFAFEVCYFNGKAWSGPRLSTLVKPVKAEREFADVSEAFADFID